ncbi:hypothetical protein [Actomonas aquatica]|uniref:Uncharacterized protein n=1 Tax=Actomonas aquatica TaxID=2866162 RepID=A0ABZ1CE17_9BACT|nr:hypothetical protein [Opitutus sp. WL0086]WRQ89905.1 hypothetical protein K1X11_010850 [Opitutus sp. WL0086]
MQTPTLIVRLLGFYLTFIGTQGLIMLHRMKSMMGGNRFGSAEIPMANDMKIWLWLSLLLGLWLVIRAGQVARWLTFDAEPSRSSGLSFSDRLMK